MPHRGSCLHRVSISVLSNSLHTEKTSIHFEIVQYWNVCKALWGGYLPSSVIVPAGVGFANTM